MGVVQGNQSDSEGEEFKHRFASPDAAPTAMYPLPVPPVGSRGSVAREMVFVPSSWRILLGRGDKIQIVRPNARESRVQQDKGHRQDSRVITLSVSWVMVSVSSRSKSPSSIADLFKHRPVWRRSHM